MAVKHREIPDEARICLARGDYAGAERCYRKVLRRRPSDAEALYMLGSLRLHAGDATDAIALIRRALDSGRPRDPAALENLGTAYLMNGIADAAERELREAIAAGGTRAVLHMRLGMALAAQGRLEEAEAALRVAQRQAPLDIDIGVNLGNTLAARGRADEALECFRRALELAPGNVDILYNIGTLYRDAGRFEEAADLYSQILEIAPEHIEALNNLGTVHERMGNVTEAIRQYRQVIALDPHHVHGYCNLANALRMQWLLDEAERCCEQALRLQPDFVDGLVNLGNIRFVQGQFDAAKQIYQRAARLVPEEPEIRYSCGMLGLALGEFADAWVDYQSRAARRGVLRLTGALDDALPDDIAGMTILVMGEQGIGDELFFLRGAALLKARGARLVCVCDGRIRALLERTRLFDALLIHGDVLPSRDVTLAAGDLPLVLGRAGWGGARPEHAQPLRLEALPERMHSMQGYLADLGPPPYLGVTWRAGTRLSNQRTWRDLGLSKEVPLDILALALRGFPGTIISLQRNPEVGETAQLATQIGAAVHDASAVNSDLEDMLALMGLVDEYVGVSNTNMHLMAGMGGQARILVPNPPEWRWMAAGDESPWFPGFALYRQASDGSWHDAMARLRSDLLRVRTSSPIQGDAGMPPVE